MKTGTVISTTQKKEPDLSLITLQISIEDYEELKSARTITLRLSVDLTVRETLHKIALKGNVFIIASNYSYGDHNYDLVLVPGSGSFDARDDEIISSIGNNTAGASSSISAISGRVLPKDKTLKELGIKNKNRLVLRKKHREQISLIILIEAYQQLNCARQVSSMYWTDENIREIVHKVARKASVHIPIEEENEYGLWIACNAGMNQSGSEGFLEYNKTLESLDLQNRDTLILRKKKEEEIALNILIEDFKELKCARKTSALFKKEQTVMEAIGKITRKSTVNISDQEAQNYDFVILNSGVKLDKEKKLSEYPLKNMDTLILRRNDRSTVLFNNAECSRVIQFSELTLVEKIGQGSFGKVYKGIFEGREVAIKVLKEVPDENILKEFMLEVALLRRVNCPQIINFFGTVEEPNRMCIIIEYASRGSLFHVMNSVLYDIGWDRVFMISLEMTKGMKYLHSCTPSIVHRDLKSLNLLVTDNWGVKICDFGLARFTTPDNKQTLSRLRSTPAWSAPELLSDQLYSTASDIYGIGMVMWELIFRSIKGRYQRPFAEFKDITFDFQIVIQASKKNLRPTIPVVTPTPMADLIARCWDGNPENRPNCDDILTNLERMQKNYEAKPALWDKSRDCLERSNNIPGSLSNALQQ